MLTSLLHFISLFLILFSLQGSYNISLLGLGKEYKMIVGMLFITGICFFGISL